MKKNDTHDEFKYILQDNKAKWTILAIHGYESNHEFILPFFKKQNNFNIIALNLPGSIYNPTKKKLTIQLFSKYIEKFLRTRIKSYNIILMGHSFGGATQLFVHQSMKIKKYIFLSSVHPFVTKSKFYSILKLIHKPFSIKEKIANKFIKSSLSIFTKVVDSSLSKFINQNPWVDLIKDVILNPKQIKFIDKKYKKIAHKSFYIVGDQDDVIFSDLFIQYVKTVLKKEIKIIKNAQHNPIYEKFNETHEYLNKIIPFKKRRFFKYLKINKKELIKI